MLHGGLSIHDCDVARAGVGVVWITSNDEHVQLFMEVCSVALPYSRELSYYCGAKRPTSLAAELAAIILSFDDDRLRYTPIAHG